MAERMYFFDSTEDNKRIYNADDFARFHAQIIGNGVSNTESLPDLEVTAGANMEVNLGSGYMFANGFMYENDSTKTLEHDVADNDNDRIDRVVIRFDRNPDLKEREGNKAIILKGAPDSNPKPPEIVREGYIYDMSVAQVRIIAGKSFIEDEEITDERSLEDLSGYIPLHNIYRGMQINELGMIDMPNQSYVEMFDDDALQLDGDSGDSYVPMDIYITPDEDKQKEIVNGNFVAKSNGTYLFYFHLALSHGLGSTNQAVESAVNVNGGRGERDRIYFFNRRGGEGRERHLLGTVTKELNEGDSVTIKVATLRTGKINSDYRRLSIVKLN